MNTSLLAYDSDYGYKMYRYKEDNYNITFEEALSEGIHNYASHACFSAIPHKVKIGDDPFKIHVSIKIEKREDLKNSSKNQIFVFTNEEVQEWIQEILKIKAFEYKVVDGSNVLLIDIFGEFQGVELLFVLTGIRYLYEFPQVHILKETFLLRRKGFMQDIDLYNSLIIAHSLYLNCGNLQGHSFVRGGSYLPKKLLKYEDISTGLIEKYTIEENIPYHEGSYDNFIEKYKEDGYVNKSQISGVGSDVAYLVRSQYKEVNVREDLETIYSDKLFDDRFNIYQDFLKKVLNNIDK